MAKDVTRLYKQFKPQHYILDIVPNREAATFTGTVIVTGQRIGKPSKRLTLHQVDLKVTNVHITHHDNKGDHEITVDRINHHASFDEVRLHATQMLYPGRYTIRLIYDGKITKPMNGMYPCLFDLNGEQKQIIATQFESHHAREVFPCIDEPEAKATFDLSLTSPANETVLANTPIVKQVKLPDTNGLVELVKTSFETTPKMSTYLLAFVYGELGYKEAKTKDGVVVRTYATPENVDFTDFSLEVAVKCLNFYNDYFGTAYPLPKADLIALPDFASGAMENWGCVTFREQCMLVDPANSTLSSKQYVAMVVAHELAHQWFGNLVTMRWWTDLWLNEGFASWIEFLAVDHIFPEWQMWTQFTVDEQHRAFRLDALQHTHPIEVAVHHPDEIRTIFDTISYSKGASVIHMLHEYLSPDVFRDGLRHYLQKHAYGNTDTVDLWQAMEEISGKPVKDFMHAWTASPGFPIVSAHVEDNSVTLKQERFFLNPKHEQLATEQWPIALLSGQAELPDLMTTMQTKLALKDTHDFKLNQGQSGFYRVSYNASHLKHLGELVKKGNLSPTDRLGILSDLFEAAKAGQADTVDALHFLHVFANEDDNAVWDTLTGAIGGVRNVMDDETVRETMKPYIRQLVTKQLARLRWDQQANESHFDRLLRPTIIGLAAGADEPTVTRHCLDIFETMKTPEDIDPDLRSTVYLTAVRHGDVATFNKLLVLHETSTLSEERTTLAAALTNFKQPELIQRALDKITTESVRLQDVSYWVAYSFMNRFARDATWTWMTTHWEWLAENLGTDLSFYRFPMFAAQAYSSQDFLAKFEDFFLPRIAPSFERSINQGIEVLQWQSAWKDRALKEVRAFFA